MTQLYGFIEPDARTLKRIAAREGLSSRTKTAGAKYPGILESVFSAARLNEELEKDQTAQATLLSWDGSQWQEGDTVTVREFWLEAGETVASGTEVLLCPLAEDYVVAPLGSGGAGADRIWVYFTLTEDMDATTVFQASATVDDAIGDGAPVAATVITVIDENARFGDCISGATGLAINWGTAASPEYKIVECNRIALRVKLRATAPICNTNNGDVTASLEYVEAIDIGGFSDDPGFANIVVTNPGRHAAHGAGTGTGDFVWAERIDFQKNVNGKWAYEICGAEQKTIKIPIEVRVKADGTKLEWKLQDISAETCQEAADATWTDASDATGDCPVPA